MEKINIQIDKPCAENFKTFKKTDTGGFCNSCKKNVVDFTKMSDQEILNYFSSEKNKTCGLFLESQLKSYSSPNSSLNKPKSSAFTSSVFGISLLSILSFNNSFSQEKTNTNETVKVENGSSKQDSDSVNLDEKFTVSGIVSDKSGPLPGANIYFKNENIGTSTDIDGKFTFPKKLKNGDVLIVTFVGYENKQIIVKNENESITMIYDVKLDNCQRIMMGAVATNKVYKSKKTVFQKIKSLFTND
ncbi:carboxypeptidase-like regulatory domain-containing protein [Flavobacterium sp. SUN052]|uniref:carboxypeptidase-like regulatory domain-containing protein n=1 Tax=Flavobacterium sp. SUN052 TaxID=3002441 RepID=UPI00237E5D7A|nr:carboxypeptidase-like regulatory domain-containing protein [Flavobacterium sp. SUN052]MEC4005178.1 carboxypeptidase-like regulatory domain-containing protein [Flavobacterium sp. SUN052]